MLRSFYFYLCFLLLFSACEKDSGGITTEETFCYHSQPVKSLYLQDAKQLLFREIQRDSTAHPDYHDPYFDSIKTGDILNIIQSIYDLSSPERDSVFDILNIHAFPHTNLRTITLGMDTSSAEADSLVKGKPTGSVIFDSLMNEFGYQLYSTTTYPRNKYLDFHTQDRYNLLPILEKLEKLSFVHSAEPGHYFAGTVDIELTRYSNYVEMDFKKGWGDCPAGCIYERHWVFKVDESCRAKFTGSYGDPYP